MSAPKHTPGPWYTCLNACGTDNQFIRSDAHGAAVARVIDVDLPTGTLEANAQLIAAAPEMLAVLKQVIRTFGDRFPDVVAVVAKAEGQKS